MYKSLVKLLLALLLIQGVSYAQLEDASDQQKDKQRSEGPINIEETLTQARIEQEELQHKKIVSAAEEMNSLAKELVKSSHDQTQLSSDNQKKLSRIEKLAKQVRSDQGGGGDDSLDKQPTNLSEALERLQEAAEVIFKESGKLTRHAVSATVIERSNEVLALAKSIKKMQK